MSSLGPSIKDQMLFLSNYKVVQRFRVSKIKIFQVFHSLWIAFFLKSLLFYFRWKATKWSTNRRNTHCCLFLYFVYFNYLFCLFVYLLFMLADLMNSLNGVYTINLSVIYFAHLKPSHTSLSLQLQSIQLTINLKTQIRFSLIEVKLAS